MSGSSASLWMFFICMNILQVLLCAVCWYHCGCFHMHDYIAGPPMSGLSASLWMFPYI